MVLVILPSGPLNQQDAIIQYKRNITYIHLFTNIFIFRLLSKYLVHKRKRLCFFFFFFFFFSFKKMQTVTRHIFILSLLLAISNVVQVLSMRIVKSCKLKNEPQYDKSNKPTCEDSVKTQIRLGGSAWARLSA